MADTTASNTYAAGGAVRPVLSAIAGFGKGVGRVLISIAESGPTIAALQRLSEVSDETLAARGTDRNNEIRRILGPRIGL